MNSAIRSGLDLLLTASSVVHIVGPGNLDESLRGCAGYHQFEFLHAEMVDALWAADVVAARAGANTIAELSALQRPAVLVPLPTTVSRGDQFENAQKFVSENRGTVVQDELMPTQLVPAILTTLASGPAPQIPDVDDVRSVARRIATDLASYLS
jgi:UDP-N-acetylglucosamine--N-acetylmuramyl-(pentapeptide) pyrophosphoryl-undecaprenol N-acetylglucosamine transferase